MRPSVDQYMMSLAKVAATRTTCIKRSVGCVLANAHGHVMAVGYNGVATGMPHCNGVREGGYVLAEPADCMLTLNSALAMMLADRSHVKADDITQARLEPYQPGHVSLRFALMPHTCKGHDLPTGQDSCEAIHAEQNALLQCRDPWQIRTAYVTLSPCKPCIKLLMNTSCERLVFLKEHSDPWPKEQWLKLGRLWEKL